MASQSRQFKPRGEHQDNSISNSCLKLSNSGQRASNPSKLRSASASAAGVHRPRPGRHTHLRGLKEAFFERAIFSNLGQLSGNLS